VIRRRLGKLTLFFISLFLFILALWLMKAGAQALAPLLEQSAIVNNMLNGLGFGWLMAYLLLSGSPVATGALTFLDAGALTPSVTFAMITGSRLGASFIILFIGFIYVWRGRDRATSLSMGLLSLIVTGTTYLLAFIIGVGLLYMPFLGSPSQMDIGSGMWLESLFSSLFDPLVNFLLRFFPHWVLFPLGVGLILISFNLFDRCLPQMTVKDSHVGQVSRLVYRPWVMLLLGAAVTLISMSVSVSLGILIPLNNRGFIRRENVIPYIMGANITTFIDTLFAAVLLSNPLATRVVWVQMVSVTIVSSLILLLGYRRYETTTLLFVDQLTADTRFLGGFMLFILALPILLLLV
jgi:sodium-dependent phosphate cotransporter